MDSNIISIRIKELRTSLKLTQKDFAASLNISIVSVSSYETSAKKPSLDILISIAKNYSVSIDWLCGLSENKSNEKKISTYTDFIKEILFLTQQKYSNLNSPIINSYYDFENNKTTLCSDCPKITDFFKEYDKMNDLLNSGTIDRELFDIWLNKQFDKLNTPINQNTSNLFEMFDIDFPDDDNKSSQ